MGSSFEATTNYRVLSENGSAALVECTPETGLFCCFHECCNNAVLFSMADFSKGSYRSLQNQL